MLHINDLVYRIGGRLIFDGATVHIPAGSRVGLVGRNGTGKSTLLKLILEQLHPDGGDISVRPRARIGHLKQEAPEGSASLIDTVLAADTERAALLAELESEPDALHMGEIHERLNAIGAHAAPARAAAILSGLGFPAEDHERAVGEYSGGWRMRVALAAALFSRADLLLLDEPTNHLDLEATIWLESHLANYPGTLIVVSHDRELLNTVATRIVHLEGNKLIAYGGNYDAFVKTRREKMDLQSKAYSKQMEQRKKIESFIDRFKAKASKARQAQSRVKMLERMETVVNVVEDKAFTLDFPDPEPLSPPVISVEGGVLGYDGKPVLRNLTFRIDMDDRIALLGANGNGKSTLAKLITGRLDLMEGSIHKSGKLRVGYFAQHQTDELNMDDTPLGHMARALGNPPESKVRAHLGRFGFGVEHANTKVGKLSGGEKARLLIALMCREQPHLMVLDEPTNHLDIDTREALMSALNAFDGAVVIISHDPHLIEATADRLWLVSDGTVAPFDGDMADYRRWLLDQARTARRDAKSEAKPDAKASSNSNRKDDRRAAAEARQRVAPLKKLAEAAEKKVVTLTAKHAAAEAELADPALYNAPPEKVAALQKDIAALARSIADAEAAWMEAMETYEQAKMEHGVA